MLKNFKSGKYKYDPIPKYMFLVRFIQGINSPTISGGTSVFGDIWGKINSDELSRLVQSVNLPNFVLTAEDLPLIGGYGIRVPARVTLDVLKINFNVEKKFVVQRFHDILMFSAIDTKTGTRKLRSNYEIDIEVGIYEENNRNPLITYTHHGCVMVESDGMGFDYAEVENLDSIPFEFYCNGGVSVTFDEERVRTKDFWTQFGASTATFALYFGQAALDLAANLALRELSLINTRDPKSGG